MSRISPSYQELEASFKKFKHPKNGIILEFESIGEKDIYNPTVICEHSNLYIAARVESRESDWMDQSKYDPSVTFFERKQDGVWSPAKNIKSIGPMEDPSATWVIGEDGDNTLILSGIVLERTTNPPTYITAFLKGKSIYSLESESFARIPMMKDIRIVQRESKNEIIVCTRPLINGWNTGRIGVIKINSISELSEKKIDHAYIDYNQTAHGTWLGASKLYVLKDKKNNSERIGVLGHVATVDSDGTQHYAAMTFSFDPDNIEDHDSYNAVPKIIATRDNFEDGPCKKDSLKDVVFPASIEHAQDGLAKLYAGLSDCRIGSILIPDPFDGYEY